MLCLRSLVLIATIAFSADASSMEAGVDSQQIVISQNITLQGSKNSYGAEVQAGAQLFLKNVNRAGGVYGRRITVRTLDDDNQSSRAEANTKKLIDEGAFAMFGSIEGGPSTAVMKAAAAKNVPFFGPMAGSPELRRPHQQLVFLVRPEHREEFRSLIGSGARGL